MGAVASILLGFLIWLIWRGKEEKGVKECGRWVDDDDEEKLRRRWEFGSDGFFKINGGGAMPERAAGSRQVCIFGNTEYY